MPKNPMVRTKWLIPSFIAIMIFLSSLVGSGWSMRPIVDYNIAEEELPTSFSLSYYPLTVSLRFRNRGNIDASLKLVVTVTNANVTVDYLNEPWVETSEAKVKLYILATKNKETFSSYEVRVYPVGNPLNFTINYTIEDVSDFWSINGMISHLFLEPHGTHPTYVVYNKTDEDKYQRV